MIGLDYDGFEKLFAVLDEGFRTYVQRWSPASHSFKDAKIYSEIVKFIDPTNLHVDVCCGTAPVLEELLIQNKAKRVIGVDINKYMLNEAENNLNRFGEVNRFFAADELCDKLNNNSIHEILSEYDSLNNSQLGKINLILGDARILESLDSLGLKQKIPSMSFTFNGCFFYALAELDRDLGSIGMRIRNDILHRCSEYLQKGGHIVYADRMAILKGKDEERVEDLGEHEAYYERENATFLPLDIIELQETIDLVPDFGANTINMYTGDVKRKAKLIKEKFKRDYDLGITITKLRKK